MDSQVLFTAWMLTAIGVCMCQNDQIHGPLNGAVGESVEFRLMNPPSAAPDIFTWSFGSTAICTAIAGKVVIFASYRDRASVDGTTATLELRNLSLSDSGEYRLNIVIGDVQSNPGTTLSVFEMVSDPGIAVSGSPGPVVADKSSVSLTCEAKGSITTRKWMKNGGTLSPEPGRVTISEDNRTVSISPVQKEDIEEYQCQVSNPVSGPIHASETLNVNYGPEAVIYKAEDHEEAAEFKEQ